jgi:hypothetical protein
VDSTIEFEVASCTVRDGHVVVGGRCLEDSIHVGDRFDSIYGFVFPDAPDDYSTQRRSLLHPTALRVVKIVTYGHVVEALDSGLTGELTLDGIPSANMVPGCVLSNLKMLR